MHVRPWIPALTLTLLTAVTTVAWVWTREPAPAQVQDEPAAKKSGLNRAAPVQEHLVDQSPLIIARSMVPLAATLEEQQLARQAERLANHEVDLAFTDALRRAASAQAPQTPEVKELAALKAKAQAAVEADQQIIDRLTKQQGAARESQKDALVDQLEVAKAQLELDQDELEAAANDLARAGGDPQARIKRLKEAHEAADKESSQAMAAAQPASAFQAGSLVARVGEWNAQRTKYNRLDQARVEAFEKAQFLTKRRSAIEAQAKQEQEDREATKYWAANLVKEAAAENGGPGRGQAKDAVSYLRQYGDVQRRLSDMGRRIQDQQELSVVYSNWMALVDGYRNAALHGLLFRLLWVLGLAILAFLAGLLIDHLFHKATEGDRKGAGTLRTVIKLAVQVLCVLVIGFVTFGMPAQTSTFLGLAGAGFTVAMKDFIVAFFGWFILMGRNGVRVGDLVEIAGVGGEVVEIGLLRTVVIETGIGNEAGHATGRRVAFVNNYAIEGHFFNFSTSGKWMWDELSVLVPPSQDLYPVIDGVQQLVAQQNEANARQAEQEWHRANSRYKVQAFATTTQGLNIVHTAGGIEIRARYITRAGEAHETRQRLNQGVVALMHGPRHDGGAATTKAEA
jgi:small-conductance mechanosensitive channel